MRIMWNKKYLPVAIVGLVVIVVLFVVLMSGDKQQKQLTEGLKIETWQTKNGAKVFFVPATQLPMVDVRVVFNAGSARDEGKAGLAYLTSLLLDNGAGSWNTSQVLERFDDIGAQFSTSAMRDMAIAHLRSLTDGGLLTTAVDTMATVIKEPLFNEVEFERERQRVLVALRNQQESPEDLAELAFYSAVYEQHPYAAPVMGTPETIALISRADLQAFYQRYYVGQNAMVVIVGAVTRNHAERIAESVVGGLPPGQAAAVLADVPPLHASKTISQNHPSSQTHIWVGQPGMTRNDADYFPLYVGNHILGGSGFGSRIVDEIRESRGLAYSSYSYFVPMQRKGPFLLGLQTKNEQAQAALKLLQEVLNKFMTEGPTAEELQHAKKNITGGFPLRIDSNKDITEQVAMMGFYNLPLDYLQTFNSKVEAVTAAQIKDAFSRRVQPNTMVTVMVGNQDANSKKP
jgi:zinc protease